MCSNFILQCAIYYENLTFCVTLCFHSKRLKQFNIFIFPDFVCNNTTIKFVMYNLIHYINHYEYFEIELCNWGKFYKYGWLIRSNYSLNIIRRSIAVAMIKYIIKPFQLYWFDQPDMIWSPSNTKKGDSLFLKERYLRNNKVI